MPAAVTDAVRPKMPPIPREVFSDTFWVDDDGVSRPHDYPMPLDKQTRKINGRAFGCQRRDCDTGAWLIAPATELKVKYCVEHDPPVPLSEIPLSSNDRDPLLSGKQRQLARLAGFLARKRQEKVDEIKAAANLKAEEARRAVGGLATDLRGHAPSLAATAAVEIGVIYTVDLASALQTSAIATNLLAFGAVIGYLVVVLERKRLGWLDRRADKAGKKTAGPTRIARRATRRGIYTAKGFAGTAALLFVLGLWNPDLTVAWQGGLVAALAVAAAVAVNGDHWVRLWNKRQWLKGEAARRAREAELEAARKLEEERLRLLEEERLRNQAAVLVDLDLNTAEGQGRRMELEWQRISGLDTRRDGFPKIDKTRIVPEHTREITAPDPETGELIRLGWEFTGVCEPGALITAGGMTPPIIAAKEWLVSVLDEGKYEASAISLIDCPDGRQNTFLLMVTERSRLGEPVPWVPGRTRVDHKGVRYGILGRSLTGEDLEEVLYTPGQPFGGIVTGQTGGGKGGCSIRHLLNLLEARIFPVLLDPKILVDYADFVGIFPIGFTKRHRRMILNFLVLERKRREAKLAIAPKTNRYGAVVAGESKWTTHDPVTGEIGVYGEPIESIWDEFHDQSKDLEFIQALTNHMRFQRAAAMGATLLSQGGGLTDWGDSMLRDLASLVACTNFRGGEMHARMAGNRNAKYSTRDLPNLPGMCLREAPGSPDIPLRQAFRTRDPEAEDTVYTTLWGKGSEPVLQIEDPLTWISEETVEIMKQTGVWDLWMMARGPGGLQRLIADDQEDEEDEETVMVASGALAMPQGKNIVPAGPPKMTAMEVLAAVLHDSPGLNRKGIAEHDFWMRAPGWGRTPSEETISRAGNALDAPPSGGAPLLDRGPKSAAWRLTADGAQFGLEMAALIPPKPEPAAGPNIKPGTPGFNPAALAEMMAARAAETQAMLAAEQAQLMAEQMQQ